MANALVYIELRGGEATRASLQALNHGRRIATRLGATLYAIVPCQTPPGYGEDDVVAVLSRYGADKVVLVANPQLAGPALYATHGLALRTTCERFPPQLVLLPASVGGRDLGARLALELDGYFAGDVDIHTDDDLPASFSRPVFRRRLRAGQAIGEAGRPLVLTLAASSVEPEELGIDEAEVVIVQAPTDERCQLRILGREPLSPRGLAVGGGSGLDAEDFAVLAKLAERLGAQLHVSASAHGGDLPPELRDCCPKTGFDGCTVDATTYLAVGISGSDGHLASLPPRTQVVAINERDDAPIGQVAQAILVRDAKSALSELLALAEERASRDAEGEA